jgi:putative ABC transport system substrate-binding protein
MRRREFITLLGGAAATWPPAARAQQDALPVVAFVDAGSADRRVNSARGGAFQTGLYETGYADSKNVIVEFQSLTGQYDRAPSLMADLVRRRVTVIATLSTPATLAAKAATTTIPIVFGIAGDPVNSVWSIASPGPAAMPRA